MVRRVRLGRRTAVERARKWAGPPPLLVVATLVGFGVVPFLDHQATAPEPQAVVVSSDLRSARAVEGPVHLPPASLARPGQGGQLTSGIKPVTRKPPEVGVASMNLRRSQPIAGARSDATRLTGRPDVDVVGWQEADPFGEVLKSLPGWGTATFRGANGPSELAVSWRRSAFSFVSASERHGVPGVTSAEGRYPFGDRLVAVVTLQHRETGRLLTVIDVHLPQAIENLDRPGRWRPTPNAQQARSYLQRIADVWSGVHTRWVVSTGDYNFDAVGDARVRPAGGPLRALAGTAVSSYEVLGTDVPPTHWSTDRRIDYVWVDRPDYDDGDIAFVGQWVLRGYNSDHRPLLTRLALS